jgi:uncharacterized membrane-anchored protein
MTTTIEPPNMNATRLAYHEAKRQKACEKSRAAYERKKERQRMQIDKAQKTPVRRFVRKHETQCAGSYYSKDPEQTSTDIGGYGVVLGNGNEIGGTAHTGLPVYLPKPDTVYDGCGNIIADKHNRPIIY